MEFVEIYTLSKKIKKIKVFKEDYEVIHNLILSVLSAEHEVSLKRLMEIGEEKLGSEYPTNLSWLIVQIKNDLAYRQHVMVKIDQERNQIIRLKKNRRGYFGQ